MKSNNVAPADIEIRSVDTRPAVERTVAYYSNHSDARLVAGSRAIATERLVTYPALDAALREAPIASEWRAPAHALPDDLAYVRESVIAEREHSGQEVWDGRVVCLDDDLDDAIRSGCPVGLREASFVEGLATNDLFNYEVGCWRSGEKLLRGVDLSVRPDGSLLPLRGNVQANSIGISTIVLLPGELTRMIVIAQSARNTASAGLLAPSGSGSLEPGDIAVGMSLQEILAGAMERELREECHLGADIDVRTLVSGYGRWVQRGGKPEFFGVSIIDADTDILPWPRHVQDNEDSFVDVIDPQVVYLDQLRDRPAQYVEFNPGLDMWASLPLMGALYALSAALKDPAFVERLRVAGVST